MGSRSSGPASPASGTRASCHVRGTQGIGYAAPVRTARWIALAVLTACAHGGSPPPSSPPPSGATPFGRLVDAYFDAKLAFEPTTSTALGLHGHDRELEDLSRARVLARAAELRGFVERLEAVAPASLN